jgi:thiol:disulfide interchange protein DsbD
MGWLKFSSFMVVAMGMSCSIRAQVNASLVAETASIQQGRSFAVALHMVQEPRWHTYWINPGTGLATSLTWSLPDGWKASDIQWPAPEALTDDTGAITGNGYEGELFLPVILTPTEDLKSGTKVELKAAVSWLMCKDVCMPGSAEISLTLPISAEAPKADPIWGERIRAVLAALPRLDPDWSVTANRDTGNVTFTVEPTRPLSHKPQGLHFFSADGYVATELPQKVTEDGKGGLVLTLPISPDGPKDPPRLRGILTSGNGWHADGSLRGLRVDVSFGAPKAPAPSTPLPPSASTGGAPGGGSVAVASFLGTVVLAFVGGMILNLMPCVFPVLGLKILGFVGHAGTARSKVVAHGLIFAGGVMASFWALAGLLIALRAGGHQLGWGFQLQSPGFVFVLAAGMLVFALNLSGVFEFGLTATGIGSGLQMKPGYGASFFTGVLATLVATPCSAPFLAPALGAALALSAGRSLAVFTAIAMGLSAPYVLLSAFPGLVRILPRPGAWMETFKQLMAFPLYATVGYLLWILAGQVQENGLLSAFFGLTLIAMAVWAYGRWNGPGASTSRIRFAWTFCFSLLALGAWTGWPRAAASTDVTWEKWSPESVAKLRSAGRTIYVDFTARWCATCQANKRLVFHSKDVLRTFREEHIATLRGDWTNADPEITVELQRYSRSAVPFNVVWLPGKDAPMILPELLTPSIVLKAVKG